MVYCHRYLDGTGAPFPAGKVICVGKNYMAHIEEMGSSVPDEPVLFLKPDTALRFWDEPILLPASSLGACHHEVELAVLIGARLSKIGLDEVDAGIAGYALALDLTLRDLQYRLVENGHPWERSKAFDGSCPVSPIIPLDELPDPQQTDLFLQVNGEMRQRGNTRMMIHQIRPLIVNISQQFTLLPGDLVLTGTPAGVGALRPGDQIVGGLGSKFQFKTEAIGA